MRRLALALLLLLLVPAPALAGVTLTEFKTSRLRSRRAGTPTSSWKRLRAKRRLKRTVWCP